MTASIEHWVPRAANRCSTSTGGGLEPPQELTYSRLVGGLSGRLPRRGHCAGQVSLLQETPCQRQMCLVETWIVPHGSLERPRCLILPALGIQQVPKVEMSQGVIRPDLQCANVRFFGSYAVAQSFQRHPEIEPRERLVGIDRE